MHLRGYVSILILFFGVVFAYGARANQKCSDILVAHSFANFRNNSIVTFHMEEAFANEEISFTLDRLYYAAVDPKSDKTLEETHNILLEFDPNLVDFLEKLPTRGSKTILGHGFYTNHSQDLIDHFIHPELLRKTLLLMQQLQTRIFAELGRKVARGKFAIRLTSNNKGISIRKGSQFGFDTDKDGLHIHADRYDQSEPSSIVTTGDTVEFVSALEGPGVIYKAGEQLIQAPTGEMVSFGKYVWHGSPSAMDPRLILVGDFTLE